MSQNDTQRMTGSHLSPTPTNIYFFTACTIRAASDCAHMLRLTYFHVSSFALLIIILAKTDPLPVLLQEKVIVDASMWSFFCVCVQARIHTNNIDFFFFCFQCLQLEYFFAIKHRGNKPIHCGFKGTGWYLQRSQTPLQQTGWMSGS